MNVHDDPVPTSLLGRALKKTGARDIEELKKIFNKGLGKSYEGRRILNSNDFSFSDIKAIRAKLKDI